MNIVAKRFGSLAKHIVKNKRLLSSSPLKTYDQEDKRYADFNPDSPVCSWNEWDPLEEVIIGIPDYAVVPTIFTETMACLAPEDHDFFHRWRGQYWADAIGKEKWKKLEDQVKEFANVCEQEGLVVKRPDAFDHKIEFTTPYFKTTGFYSSMPRDCLIIVGDEIIESSMGWRNRQYEYVPYRDLVLDYWKRGAKWTQAPKPLFNGNVVDETYVTADDDTQRMEETWPHTEYEPLFDAADFTRAGRDIFAQRSHATNSAGIEWMRRHLAPKGIKVHEVTFGDPWALHIDCTFLPIKPGVFISYYKYPPHNIKMFEKCGWKMYTAPTPVLDMNGIYFGAVCLANNVLMLDEKRCIVEKQEEPLQKLLKSIGIEPILVNFKDACIIGGGFHCWTSDIRRRGKLESYF